MCATFDHFIQHIVDRQDLLANIQPGVLGTEGGEAVPASMIVAP
jgi:hypothetical protein